MKTMAKYPGLMRRGSRWYLRVKVPADLVEEVGRREIWRSLETGSHRKAVGRYHQVRGEVQALLEAARRRLRGGGDEVNDAELRRLAAMWFQGLDRKVADADHGRFDDARREALASTGVDEAVLEYGSEEEWAPAAQAQADELLSAAGLVLDKGGDGYRSLCDYIRRGMLEAARRSRARLRGEAAGRVFDTMFGPSATGTNNKSATRLTLADLVEEFMGEPQQAAVTEKTRRGRLAMLGVLESLLGEGTAAGDVTRRDARRVRDTLLALPPNASKRWPGLSPGRAADAARKSGTPAMSTTMVNSYLGCFIALFRHAVREHGLPGNPFEGLRVRGAKAGAARKRRSFTEDELRALAENPPPGSLALVTLVSLYNGLRLGEVLGLRPEDVREVGGVLCLDVREYDGRTLKTRSSERLVPAHPVVAPLLREHMAGAGGGDPWPDLPRRDRASVASKRANRHLRRLGMRDPGLVFHSCRHSFRDRLREAGVSRDAVLRLGGWSAGGVEEQYGSGASPRALLRELKKVEYPVDLSRMWRR